MRLNIPWGIKRRISLARWCGILVAIGGWPVTGFAGETAIEGTVELPPVRPPSAVAMRYRSLLGRIGEPEPSMAVVYIEGQFAPVGSNPPPRLRLAQKDYQFVPRMLPVRRGTTVEFPNYDADYHSVFSYSKARRFDLGRYEKDAAPPAILFDQPGVVKLNCEIHPHMRGTVLVLETPYFVKTDTNGHYRLVVDPALTGRHLLKAWVDEKDVRETPVDVQPGAVMRVDFPGAADNK